MSTFRRHGVDGTSTLHMGLLLVLRRTPHEVSRWETKPLHEKTRHCVPGFYKSSRWDGKVVSFGISVGGGVSE